MKNLKTNGIFYGVIALLGVLAIGTAVLAYTITKNITVSGDYINYEAGTSDEVLGVSYSPDISGKYDMVELLAKTSISATTTIRATQSGTTFYLKASGTTVYLPKVEKGLRASFVVNGAIDTGNYIIASSEGDNIEGTLIVAGAVVDCAGEDFVNFIADGENVGDYVEFYSDGTQWLIGDSGVLTSAKMTCTDPS